MGDRGNIAIAQHSQQGEGRFVVLYTYWDGSELPAMLVEALHSKAGRARWGDEAYLARIIFNRMTRDDPDGETGYGISTSIQDNEHPILVVDAEAEAVSVLREYQLLDYEPGKFPSITFERLVSPDVMGAMITTDPWDVILQEVRERRAA